MTDGRQEERVVVAGPGSPGSVLDLGRTSSVGWSLPAWVEIGSVRSGLVISPKASVVPS